MAANPEQMGAANALADVAGQEASSVTEAIHTMYEDFDNIMQKMEVNLENPQDLGMADVIGMQKDMMFYTVTQETVSKIAVKGSQSVDQVMKQQ